jgi:hypothetical protein
LGPTGGPCPPRANRGANGAFDFREAHGKSPEEDITKGLFPDKVNRINTYSYRLLPVTPSTKKSTLPRLFSFRGVVPMKLIFEHAGPVAIT